MFVLARGAGSPSSSVMTSRSPSLKSFRALYGLAFAPPDVFIQREADAVVAVRTFYSVFFAR